MSHPLASLICIWSTSPPCNFVDTKQEQQGLEGMAGLGWVEDENGVGEVDMCGVRDMLCQVDLSQWGNNGLDGFHLFLIHIHYQHDNSRPIFDKKEKRQNNRKLVTEKGYVMNVITKKSLGLQRHQKHFRYLMYFKFELISVNYSGTNS